MKKKCIWNTFYCKITFLKNVRKVKKAKKIKKIKKLIVTTFH